MGDACLLDVVRSARELEAHVGDWSRLADHALEDNAYLTPWFLWPLLEQYEDATLQIVLVRCATSGELLAIAPFSMCPATRHVPLPSLSTLISPHAPLTMPMLHRDRARDALSAIASWAAQGSHPWSLVLLEHVPERSPTWALWRELLAARALPSLVRKTVERPILIRRASFEDYIGDLPSSRRKGFRRHLRALERVGKVKFRIHRDLAEAGDVAERFMDLEAKSWKGEAGTALASTPRDRAYFKKCVERAGAARALFFVELTLDGTTIGMSTNFIHGKTLFAFKIAYDPAFADHSPGMLVELEGIRAMHDESECVVADSGSTSGSYVRAYFREEATLQWIWIGTERPSGRAFVLAMPWLLRARETVKALRSARTSA